MKKGIILPNIAFLLLFLSCTKQPDGPWYEPNEPHPTWTDNDSNDFWDKHPGEGKDAPANKRQCDASANTSPKYPYPLRGTPPYQRGELGDRREAVAEECVRDTGM